MANKTKIPGSVSLGSAYNKKKKESTDKNKIKRTSKNIMGDS